MTLIISDIKRLECISSAKEALERGLVPIGEPVNAIGKNLMGFGGYLYLYENAVPVNATAYVRGNHTEIQGERGYRGACLPVQFYKEK